MLKTLKLWKTLETPRKKIFENGQQFPMFLIVLYSKIKKSRKKNFVEVLPDNHLIFNLYFILKIYIESIQIGDIIETFEEDPYIGKVFKNSRRLEIVKKLGKGSFGSVYLVNDTIIENK